MYVPSAFAQTDRALLLAYAASHPFATVITSPCAADVASGGESVAVSHLPLLVDAERGVLRGHLARENPQFAHFADGAKGLAVFHGPHGYVSPSVYTEPGVPTWNFVVVHAHGRLRLVDEKALETILRDTIARFDRTEWSMEAMSEESLRAKLGAIAGFEMNIEGIEGKWKLSQNRSPEDRARVVEWLERGDDASRATAALMREALEGA
jgi:transcriptional regulator